MVWDSTPNSPVRTPIPGGWYGSELARNPGSWRIPLPSEVRDDLLRIAADLGSGGISADPYQPRPQVNARTRSLIAELYRRLAGEPGVVVLTGFPVTEGPELTEAAYLLLGKLLGQPVMQRLDGNLLARVEAAGPDAKVPGAQRIVTPSMLPFHVDRSTDLIGLLCVRSARAGGLSRLISFKMVHNLLLARHPDLLSVLYQPLPIHVPPTWGPSGDQAPYWCEAPIFSQVDGHFSAYYSRMLMEEAQLFPDAPRLAHRMAAIDAIDELTEEPGLPLEMALQPGDLQLINNLSLLHSRTSYRDETPGHGRLLLRLHLAFAGSPALPTGYAALFGASTAGTYRGGLWRTHQVQEWFGTPLRAGGAA
jgi:hypothetical protein